MQPKKIVAATVDPRVWALIEKAAKAQKVSVSSYVEGALLWDLISDGNVEALKIATGRILGKIRKRYLEQMLGDEVTV